MRARNARNVISLPMATALMATTVHISRVPITTIVRAAITTTVTTITTRAVITVTTTIITATIIIISPVRRLIPSSKESLRLHPKEA